MRQRRSPLERKIVGRDLLVSSHAGTRLPIAVIPDPGRSPSIRHGHTVDARFPSFRAYKNQETPVGTSPGHNSIQYDSLRRHDPHQVKGRSDTASSQLASQAPLCFDCKGDYTPQNGGLQEVF